MGYFQLAEPRGLKGPSKGVKRHISQDSTPNVFFPTFQIPTCDLLRYLFNNTTPVNMSAPEATDSKVDAQV
jgi:hypothetical protein